MLLSADSLSLEEQKVQDYFEALRKRTSPSRRLPERIVSAVWFDGAFDKSKLCTNDLRKIEIISPGRWNEGPGPDFLEAEIKISDRKRVCGDIEIEVNTSDWDKHSHKKSSDSMSLLLFIVHCEPERSGARRSQFLTFHVPFISFASDRENDRGPSSS